VNLNSILIGSADPQRLKDYYTKLFGTPGWNEGGYSGWQLGTGFVTVGPHDQVTGSNTQPGRLIWNIETSDVKGDFERLKAAGATVIREPYQPGDVAGAWIATFADPDNNYFQIMSPMPMSVRLAAVRRVILGRLPTRPRTGRATSTVPWTTPDSGSGGCPRVG